MLTQKALDNFTGTEHHYIHALSGFKYTDGVKYLADEAKAYWLLDKILILIRHKKKVQVDFSVWKLDVKEHILNSNLPATLTCEDGNGNVLHKEKIEYTDFPMSYVEVWYEQGVLLLPSEH
jgi:hypothetical protein